MKGTIDYDISQTRMKKEAEDERHKLTEMSIMKEMRSKREDLIKKSAETISKEKEEADDKKYAEGLAEVKDLFHINVLSEIIGVITGSNVTYAMK